MMDPVSNLVSSLLYRLSGYAGDQVLNPRQLYPKVTPSGVILFYTANILPGTKTLLQRDQATGE